MSAFDLVCAGQRPLAMTPEGVAKVRALEAINGQLPQIPITTHHVLHGGMYHRTICVQAGSVLTGAQINVATTLVVSGHVRISIGTEAFDLEGYHVLPAAAGRKQAFLALADTHLTMSFPTQAKTIEEAENEFTDEADRLVSRHGHNVVVITGE